MTQYNEQEKARAYITLQNNDGNISRTAKELGITRVTLYRWNEEWKNGRVPELVRDLETGDKDVWLIEAERARFNATTRLADIAQEATSVKDLAIAIQTLTDKINVTRGATTNRTEHRVIVDREEMRGIMGEFAQSLSDAAAKRHAEIIDAEVVVEPSRGELDAPKE